MLQGAQKSRPEFVGVMLLIAGAHRRRVEQLSDAIRGVTAADVQVVECRAEGSFEFMQKERRAPKDEGLNGREREASVSGDRDSERWSCGRQRRSSAVLSRAFVLRG